MQLLIKIFKLFGVLMKTFIVVLVLSFCIFSCNSKEVHEVEKNNLTAQTLIPQEEYLTVPDEFSQKIMSSKLIEQMSVKNYLFKNNEIAEEAIKRSVGRVLLGIMDTACR
jgi:hypothetical protein